MLSQSRDRDPESRISLVPGTVPNCWVPEFRVSQIWVLQILLMKLRTQKNIVPDLCSSRGPSPGSRIFQISVPVQNLANFEYETRSQSQILLWVPVPVPVPDFRDRDRGIPATLSRMPTPGPNQPFYIIWKNLYIIYTLSTEGAQKNGLLQRAFMIYFKCKG